MPQMFSQFFVQIFALYNFFCKNLRKKRRKFSMDPICDSKEKFDNKMKLNLFFRRLFPLIPGDTTICWRDLASNFCLFPPSRGKRSPGTLLYQERDQALVDLSCGS